jgi:S1-C subfamily serine protease
VLAIGDPFGVGQTVTNGIISALARTGVGGDESYYLQTDAAINPGNSGGALVNMNGDMIGMNSAILSQSGTSSGVGFAIPAALIKRVVENALGGAGPTSGRPWLGLKTQTVTADIARTLGEDRPEGVLVTDVYPGGPGDQAGLKQGDLILTLDGEPIEDEAGLTYRVLTHRAGDAVVLKVRRGRGPEQSLRVKLATPPGGESRAERLLTGRNPFAGASVIDLTPAAADALGLDPFEAKGGVLVTKVGEGVAAGIGVQPGDIIRAVNGQPITSVAQLQSLLASGGPGWRFVLVRGGQELRGQVGL